MLKTPAPGKNNTAVLFRLRAPINMSDKPIDTPRCTTTIKIRLSKQHRFVINPRIIRALKLKSAPLGRRRKVIKCVYVPRRKPVKRSTFAVLPVHAKVKPSIKTTRRTFLYSLCKWLRFGRKLEVSKNPPERAYLWREWDKVVKMVQVPPFSTPRQFRIAHRPTLVTIKRPNQAPYTVFAYKKGEPWFFKFKFKREVRAKVPRVTWGFHGGRYVSPQSVHQRVGLSTLHLKCYRPSPRITVSTRQRVLWIRHQRNIKVSSRTMSILHKHARRKRRLRHRGVWRVPRRVRFYRKLVRDIYHFTSCHFRQGTRIRMVRRWYSKSIWLQKKLHFRVKKVLNWWYSRRRWKRSRVKHIRVRQRLLKRAFRHLRRKKSRGMRNHLRQKSWIAKGHTHRIRTHAYRRKRLTRTTLRKSARWTYLFAGVNDGIEDYCDWDEASEEPEYWDRLGDRWKLPYKVRRACLPTKRDDYEALEDVSYDNVLYRRTHRLSWWHPAYAATTQRKIRVWYAKKRLHRHQLYKAFTFWKGRKPALRHSVTLHRLYHKCSVRNLPIMLTNNKQGRNRLLRTTTVRCYPRAIYYRKILLRDPRETCNKTYKVATSTSHLWTTYRKTVSKPARPKYYHVCV